MARWQRAFAALLDRHSATAVAVWQGSDCERLQASVLAAVVVTFLVAVRQPRVAVAVRLDPERLVALAYGGAPLALRERSYYYAMLKQVGILAVLDLLPATAVAFALVALALAVAAALALVALALAVAVALAVRERTALAFPSLLDRLAATAVAVLVAKAVRKRAPLAVAPLLDRLSATAVTVLVAEAVRKSASLAVAPILHRMSRYHTSAVAPLLDRLAATAVTVLVAESASTPRSSCLGDLVAIAQEEELSLASWAWDQGAEEERRWADDWAEARGWMDCRAQGGQGQ